MKYLFLLAKSFQSNLVYRSALLWSLLFSALSFALQIGIWSVLIGSGVKKDVTLHDMIFYIMLNQVILTITHVNVESQLEEQIKDGSVVMHFLRPASFKLYYLSATVGDNLFRLLTNVMPIFLVGALVVGVPAPADGRYLLYSVISMLLGMLIKFELSFMVGLLAFWLQETWYLWRYVDAGLALFGGTVLPLWFFPGFFDKLSMFLPFRYITFESINFYLGKTASADVSRSLLGSAMWFLVLYVAERLVWMQAQKKLTINGG